MANENAVKVTSNNTVKSAAKSASAPASSSSDKALELYYRLVEFYEKNQQLVIGAGVVLVLAVGGFVFWNQQQATREAEASAMLRKAMTAYKDENFELAVNGDSTSAGLAKLVTQFSGTATGETAKLYLANIYFQKGSLDSALQLYSSISTSAPLVAAAATAGEAACYEQKKDFKKAASLYKSAAAKVGNDGYVSVYLNDAARAFELAGEKKEALELLERLKKEFSDTKEGRDAEKAIARLKS
jgi:tetratricopeptide (TPR) repeat protein